MKAIISVNLFVLLTSLVSAQSNLEKRISEVENGLTLQSTIGVNQEMISGNILNRLKESKINGASVAVIYDGQIDWVKAYGTANGNQGEPVTTATLFQCASIGKVITALVALNLVKEGKLDLDEDVNDKLVRWKIQENEITKDHKVTLRHLLSHSAGLTDDYGFLGYSPGKAIPTVLQILKQESPANAKKSLEIKTTPGEIERYSGGGYLIIQLLIEDITGNSFEEQVQQVIFQPVQMANSTYDYRPDLNLKKKIASGHLTNGKALKKKKYHIYPEKAAAGPWTTAEDLAKLVVQIQKEVAGESDLILDQKMVSEFLSPQINNKGLGVNLKGLTKPEAFWHAGQNLGFTGILYGLIDRKEGAIMLLNSDGGETIMQEFITSVAHAYQWPVMRSAQVVPHPDGRVQQLIGTFRDLENDKTLIIAFIDGQLQARAGNAKKGYALYQIGENHYTFKDAQDYLKISFDWENEEVKSLLYTESIGKTVKMLKVE